MFADQSLVKPFRAHISLVLAVLLVGAWQVSNARAQVSGASDCSVTSVGLTPLNELAAGFYQGQQGGLYPLGQNVDLPEHRAVGMALAQGIVPLGPAGEPDPNGQYALLSIGMSNAQAEFEGFAFLAADDPEVDRSRLVIVNGAQGGWDAQRVADPDAAFWTNIDQRLAMAGVTPLQVVAAWVKEADAEPMLPFPDDVLQLQSELVAISQIMKQRYPNLQLAYYSSRIYAGYATTRLNPEPFAYESGFAVKWLIQAQLEGDPSLNFDPSRGDVLAPWIAWGSYLWADGLSPRSDGLTWACADFGNDGTHPGADGVAKVGSMLLNFFKTDTTTRRWFVAAP